MSRDGCLTILLNSYFQVMFGVTMDFSAHKSNPGTDALPVRTRDLYSECRDIVSSMKFSNFTKSWVDERDSKENIYFSADK